MRTMLLMPLALTFGCADAATVGGKNHGGLDTSGETADSGGDFSSPFTGDWTGTAGGFAQFYDDWDTVPYCAGDVTATVEATGTVTGAGECIIDDRSPYAGEVFDVSFSGQVTAEGEVAVDVIIDEATQTHGFGDTSATGAGDATAKTLSAEGDTMYYPAGIDAVVGFVRIELSGS